MLTEVKQRAGRISGKERTLERGNQKSLACLLG